MKGDFGLFYDDIFLSHDIKNGNMYFIEEKNIYPETFIENKWRIQQIYRILQTSGIANRMIKYSFEKASDDQIKLIHSEKYLLELEKISLRGYGDAGDGGTPMNHTSLDVAKYAAGAVLEAVNAIIDNEIDKGYCLIRPPGHHALPEQGYGFCIFNNSAIGAAYAINSSKFKRVMIIDFDAHHGNGTQEAFYNTSSVFTISMHQEDLYPPGSGNIDELGTGDGEGYNINIPLPAAIGNEGYLYAWEKIIEPVAKRFSPDLIIVAAGQDASFYDPMARMALTSSGFRMIGNKINEMASIYSEGKVLIIQEGGYNTSYAPYCALATIEAIGDFDKTCSDPYLQFIDNSSLQNMRDYQLEHLKNISEFFTKKKLF